jgi:hypothetical protein
MTISETLAIKIAEVSVILFLEVNWISVESLRKFCICFRENLIEGQPRMNNAHALETLGK